MSPDDERGTHVHELIVRLGAAAVDVGEAARKEASTDATAWLEPRLPLAVVRPREVGEVRETLAIASARLLPVTVRGAGTGLSGGARPVPDGIVLDLSRMDRVLEIDPVSRTARVQAGVINAQLDRAAAEHGLAFAPDPASAARCTVGGNIATNAGGLRRLKYGATRQSVLSVTAVLASGELVGFGAGTPKDVTGLDLLGLMVGSEGTLGVIAEATVSLIPRPHGQRMMLAACADWLESQRLVRAIMGTSVTPSLLELMDAGLGRGRAEQWTELGISAAAGAVLMVEVDGPAAAAELALIRSALDRAGAPQVVELDAAGREHAMLVRRGEIVHDPEPSWWLGEDITVPIAHIAEFFAQAELFAREADVDLAVVAHVGDGNVHPSLSVRMDGADEVDARRRLHRVADQMVRLALALGGALTGEHGVGQLKREWLELALPPRSLELQRSIRRAFDPHGILNPAVSY